jgi:hypothetical protein
MAIALPNPTVQRTLRDKGHAAPLILNVMHPL